MFGTDWVLLLVDNSLSAFRAFSDLGQPRL